MGVGMRIGRSNRDINLLLEARSEPVETCLDSRGKRRIEASSHYAHRFPMAVIYAVYGKIEPHKPRDLHADFMKGVAGRPPGEGTGVYGEFHVMGPDKVEIRYTGHYDLRSAPVTGHGMRQYRADSNFEIGPGHFRIDSNGSSAIGKVHGNEIALPGVMLHDPVFRCHFLSHFQFEVSGADRGMGSEGRHDCNPLSPDPDSGKIGEEHLQDIRNGRRACAIVNNDRDPLFP